MHLHTPDYKLLVFTLRNSNFFFFFNNTVILFHWGIHSYITSMIHCTDSYKLMSITFWKHCRFSSISLKTRTVRAWSAEGGFSDYQATS